MRALPRRPAWSIIMGMIATDARCKNRRDLTSAARIPYPLTDQGGAPERCGLRRPADDPRQYPVAISGQCPDDYPSKVLALWTSGYFTYSSGKRPNTILSTPIRRSIHPA